MKEYRDAHMKIFSPYIISKHILKKESTRDITYSPVFVKKILNVLWYAKNSLI